MEGEVKIIDGKWALDEDTGTIVRKGRYYIPGFVVGVDTGVKGASLSNIEQLTPRHKRQGGATTPDNGDTLDVLWAMYEDLTGGEDFEKAVKEFEKLDSLWNEARNHKCGVYIWAKCQHKHCGTRVISRVPCKREWCPYCGREQSYFHLIYYYKILHYALIMFMKNGGRLGYLVITTTPELRQQFLEDPEKMHKFREDIKEKLKDLGYKYGIWRWHFAGDEGRTWYPHLNVLIPEGYMPDEKLTKFKRWIQKKYGVKVVNYEWTEELGKVKHWARYIARPTWNLQNDAEPEKFKGMRKYGIWGNKHFKDLKGVLTESEAFFLALALVVDEMELKKALRELQTGEVERDLTLVLYLIQRGRCVKCGGEVKWDFAGFSGWGVLQGLRAGELHRISWSTWVYVPKEGPPPDDKDEFLEED
ncbi:MAG: hypothetical protein ACO2OT_06565 [Candidatus Caldipriscus sp.]